MQAFKVSAPILALAGIMLFAACNGESLDFVLSTGGIYNVDAYINEYSLNTCSIIRQNDSISPYFVSSISNDPDIQGLIVFLRTPEGTLADKKTWYTISETMPELAEQPPPAKEPAVFSPDSPPPASGEAKPETESPLPRANVIENSSLYRIVTVKRLDRNLPPFTLSESVEIGRYLMVFEIVGEKAILYTIEKPVFVLGDAVFVFDAMQSYLPSSSLNSSLVPPGTNVLLEAEIASDERLDPYIVWYDGKRRMKEGLLSAKSNRLMWKAPEKTGFHTVKAVVYPFKPIENTVITGAARELSLPISSKSKNIGYFAKQANQFIHWYQFQNNLLDAKSPSGTNSLILPDKQEPHWMPYNTIYGLALENRYILPDASFLFNAQEEGSAEILLHAVPLGEGTIFTAEFKTFKKTDFTPETPLILKTALKEQNLIITAELGDASCQSSLDMTGIAGFITLSITFRLGRSEIAAAAAVAETAGATQEIVLKFDGIITGEGTFQLGETASEPVALLDEAGVAFTKKPLPPEPKPLEAEETSHERLAETPHTAETT
ncbi:MAG: hypothetical protein LBG73_05670 [Spirochaetaceae bacterium]|jgi:hypothetical protein|nr:hypothetical protein [Spirochaetaceae bacterium]